MGRIGVATKYTDSEARAAAVSDAAYAGGWNGVTTVAASKNAVYDKIETLGAATKEFFVLPSQYIVFGDVGNDGSHTGIKLDAGNEIAYFEFYIPQDFSGITSVVVVVIPFTTATHRLNFYSEYAAHGEAKDTHSETSADNDFALTDNEIDELDISGELSSLAAGDYVAFQVEADPAVNIPNLLVIGLRFKYS